MASGPAGAPNQSLVISYLALRKIVGVLGLGLPFIVSLGAALVFHQDLQDSISAYYYTGTRDVFVGLLFAIGVFLLSYRGYERKDSIAGNVACAGALGVALFPTTSPDADHATPIGVVHYTFAALFFLTLAYFSLFLFTKTNQQQPTIRKRQRNGVYKVCGIVMLVCIVLMLAQNLLTADFRHQYRTTFVLETAAIVAFGISWLTKGKAILPD